MAVGALLAVATAPASAQWTPLQRGSDNIEVLGHLPLGGPFSAADTDIEQELSRPYAYVGRTVIGEGDGRGVDIIDLSDPERPSVLYEWRIEDDDIHVGAGGMDVKHFKVNGRYFVVQSLQFGQGGPDSDLGAVVLDVTAAAGAARVSRLGSNGASCRRIRASRSIWFATPMRVSPEPVTTEKFSD